MLPGMSATALKEWDAQCSLLTSGEVSVLIRKGGIMETHDGFEVERRSFLLYPTFLHQNPGELKPEHAGRLRPDPDPGRIHVPALAEVVAVHRVESLGAARALEPWQALTADAIERKFHYRGRPWVHALVLRVCPLTRPVVLDETPDMLGCVSWVPLGGLDMQAGASVLDEPELRARAQALEDVLQPRG